MKSYFNAISILFNSIDRSINVLGLKKVDILASINKISTSVCLSTKNVPSFNNSAMDGYALRYKNTLFIDRLKPKSFIIVDTVMAGEHREFDDLDGEFVVEIMTGARVPFAFDSIIKFEDVLLNKNDKSEIIINRTVKLGENVRKIGEDFFVGDILLRKGDVISSSHILTLSAADIKNVTILKQPKIYLLCTGNEIMDSHDTYDISKKTCISNSAGPYIINFLKLLDLNVNYLGVIKDIEQSFINKVNSILNSNVVSLIITTGAVSKGHADFIPRVLRSMGVDILFHGVKMKPGKPILFARFNPYNYFFCLPGNPISSIIGLRFFIYPFLRFLFGQGFEKPLKAKLAFDYTPVRKCDIFLKAYCYSNNAVLYVRILESQESFKVGAMLVSNAFVFLKMSDISKKDELLDVFFYKPISS